MEKSTASERKTYSFFASLVLIRVFKSVGMGVTVFSDASTVGLVGRSTPENHGESAITTKMSLIVRSSRPLFLSRKLLELTAKRKHSNKYKRGR
jgi:hypothetical protein